MTTKARRILYVLFIIAVATPMIRPTNIPLIVKPETRDLYEAIDRLEPGDAVLVSSDYSPGTASDVHAAAVAIFKHLMDKDLRVIGVSFTADGPQFAEQMLATAPQGKEYGINCVELGYRAGGENAISAFAQDPWRTFPTDIHGKPAAELPALAGISDAKDLALIISIAGGEPGPVTWIRQVGQTYGIPVGGVVTTVMVPHNLPYYQSKQLVALLYGLRGAAEYENLVSQPGAGLAGMGSQSAAAVFILGAIAIGNVFRFANAKKGEHAQ